MEEEQPKSPVPEAAGDAVEEQPSSPPHVPDTDKQESSTETKADTEEQKPEETKEPTDWFEPLEDDDGEDANSFEFPAEQRALGPKDLEEESVAGESERSESVVGSEKSFKRKKKTPRRKQFRGNDEGWEDCPTLGEGWKRKETIRQSGTRSGQSDIYYMSPHGDRARSRIELSILMNRDLSSFEYKSGVFRKNGVQRLTLQRRKRKCREHSTSDVAADQTSDSSFVERGEGADTPDSHHRLTPTVSSKLAAASSKAPSTTDSPKRPQIKQEKIETPPPDDDNFQCPDDQIKLPGPASSKPLHFPSINGEFGPDDSFLVCARCGLTFTGTWYDKQRKKPFCPSCWAFKAKEHPLIRFRKWVPCGQCVGCRNKINCGHCSNCKDRSPEIRKRTCRKRKCLSPIRKGPGGLVKPKQNDDPPEDLQDFTYYNHLNVPSGDTEDFMTPLEMDEDDDGSTDDDEDWHKRRKRRACGDCPACLRKDCGTCDFCIDKPKFGGSNKKRQKCRLRQCQRQAMRHLLPSQFGGDADDATIWGRAKPQYTYSRKRKRAPPSDDEDEEKSQWTNDSIDYATSSKTSYKQNIRKKQSSMQVNNSVYGQPNGVSVDDHHNSTYRYNPESKSRASNVQRQEKEDDKEDYPTITQIYSLADEPSDLNKEHDLMKMLDSLRSSALPILWYAVMVEGPQIQLVQCSKMSAMADTTVQINTDFTYNISVQRHPLLPTHPLYDAHPLQMDSVTTVVDLLLDLDRYIVCHGLPPTQAVLCRNPIILERAATCKFLIKKNETICTNCRMLCE